MAESIAKQDRFAGAARQAIDSIYFRLYSLSLHTGRYTLKLFDAVAKSARSVWRLTLSDAFDRVSVFFHRLGDAKKSKIVRGELSVTRALFSVTHRSSAMAETLFRAFSSRGTSAGFKYILGLLKEFVVTFWAKYRRVFNYAAPVAGMAVLTLTLWFWSHMTFALEVQYNGRALGAVSTESVYKAAASDVETKVSDASGASFSLNKTPVYKLQLVNKSELLNEDELYDSILKASGNDVVSGYGLYVDNRLVGATGDSASIQTMLDDILASYKNDPNNEKVAFSQDVTIKQGVFPKTVEQTADSMKNIVTASAKDVQTYTAKKGDSAAMVANQFHITVDQLYAMNSSVQVGNLTQGQTIQVVDSNQPVLSVKYTRRETSTQSIPFSTNSVEDSSLAKGRTVVTTQGKNGTMQVTSYVTYLGGKVVESKQISTTMLKAPVTQQQKVGTFDFTVKAANMISYSEHFIGSSYSYGASGPYAFDCSGYTAFVFAQYGVYLPHNAAAQASYGTPVSRGSLQPGDLVFFNTMGYGISHVGIYVGGGQFVNALNYRSGVTYNSLNEGWASSEYVCARRVW